MLSIASTSFYPACVILCLNVSLVSIGLNSEELRIISHDWSRTSTHIFRKDKGITVMLGMLVHDKLIHSIMWHVQLPFSRSKGSSAEPFIIEHIN